MEVKNQMLNIIVGSLIGVLVSASLIFSVTFGINMALAPLSGSLKEVGALSARVTSLEGEVKALKNRPAPQAQAPQQPPEEDLSKVYDIPVADSYVLGNPSAKITIVEYSDLQCPFCARFHPAIKEALKAFPNDVKIVFKNYPLGFHQNARPAAKAALAAGLQGKYYEMIDGLLENAAALSDEKYKELAGKLGLNVDQFVSDLKNKDADFEKKIAADMALADKSDVRGTPTYFLNGKKTNARDIQGWTAQIQELLKQ